MQGSISNLIHVFFKLIHCRIGVLEFIYSNLFISGAAGRACLT